MTSYDIQLTATTCDPLNAGVVVQNLASIEGCDSIVTTTTTLLPSDAVTINATTCNPANVGTTVQNLLNLNGCDSVVTTITTLLRSDAISLVFLCLLLLHQMGMVLTMFFTLLIKISVSSFTLGYLIDGAKKFLLPII
jgi:hypothetical protein